jgi:micrococcal nuclease
MVGAIAIATALLAPAPAAVARPVTGHVVYVVDGDTIHVQLGSRLEKVRYIGVNAAEIPHRSHPAKAGAPYFPHTPAAGEAAKRINIDLVGGKSVRLEFDRRRRDDYHRLLAYVYVGELMVNAEMVRRGYAEVMSVPPDFRHRALFVKLQEDARAAGRGLWQSSPPARLPPPAKAAPSAPARR